jgi:hypothetical protein
MPTFVGTQRSRSPHASSASGNTWTDNNLVAPTALAINDVVVLLDVPAGVELDSLGYYGGDFDTGTTLAYKIGYRTKLAGGTQTADDAFGTGITVLRAATTAWQELTFAPVKFNEPVEVVLTVTTATTGISGTPDIKVRGRGRVVGIS